jgi:hypothetical protein
LIHILALPAQLRKSFCRSFFEKKRSITGMSKLAESQT